VYSCPEPLERVEFKLYSTYLMFLGEDTIAKLTAYIRVDAKLRVYFYLATG
jgi:hypothetical protein